VTATAEDELRLVAIHRLVESGLEIAFPLAPGDRPLVEVGESVTAGAPIAEQLRNGALQDQHVPAGPDTRPGGRVQAGELLFEWRGRWRTVGGDVWESIESPVAGTVREATPGSGIVITTAGQAIRGIVALGGPTRGRLHVAAGADGELRAGGLDVGLAGTILVVGSRIDAETLTRARAMGIRGIVVAGLASKARRDYLASEARQRAALHRLPPFAVLVLDGAMRRPLASPLLDVLAALEGREVAIVGDPPALLFEASDLELPAPALDLVRIRGGDMIGREGRWLGLVGQRRFPGGIHLEAASVRLRDGSIVAVPLGDIERFV